MILPHPQVKYLHSHDEDLIFRTDPPQYSHHLVSVDSIQWNSLIFLFQVAGHLTSLSRLQQHLEPLSPLLLDKTFYLALISPSFKWKSKYSTQKRSPEITDWAVRQIVNLFNQPRPLGDHDLGVIQYGLYNEGRFQESLDYFSLISYPQLKNFRAALDCMGKLGHPKITLYTTQLDTKQACYDTFDQAVRRFGVGSIDSRTWNFLIRCVIKFGDVAEGRRVLDDMTVQSSSPTSSAQPSAFIYMELVLALFKDNQESAGRQFLELAIQEAILGGKDSQGRVFQMYVQFLIDDAHRPDQAWTFFKKWTDVMHLYIPRSGVEKLLQGLRQDQDRLKKNKWAREISQLTLLLQTLNKRV